MARLDAAKELAIGDFISDATGITTIWDKPSSQTSKNRPSLPYCTMNIISISEEGDVDIDYKSEDTYTYTNRQAFTLSVQIFSQDDYLDIAEKIRRAAYKESKRIPLKQAGIALREVGDTTDISALIETGFEKRAGIDLFMSTAVQEDEADGEIRSAKIEKTNEPTFTITITS